MGSKLEGKETAANPLTVHSMQESRMKSNKIDHLSCKRKPIQTYQYIKLKPYL